LQPPVLAAQAAALEPPTPAPTLRERLRNFLFGQRSESTEPPAPVMRTTVPAVYASPIKPTGTVSTVTTKRPNLDLAEKDLQRVGHEKDYSWITGKLSRAPGEAGRWVIRYAGPYEQDTYGGALLLSKTADLTSTHEEDLVCVHGKVVTSSQLQRSGARTVYEVEQVSIIEKAGR
jgi:hypothetical protein